MNNVLFTSATVVANLVLRNKYCNVAIATTAVTAEPTARPPREHTGDELWTTCGVYLFTPSINSNRNNTIPSTSPYLRLPLCLVMRAK